VTTLLDVFTSDDPHAGHADGTSVALALARSVVPLRKYIDSPYVSVERTIASGQSTHQQQQRDEDDRRGGRPRHLSAPAPLASVAMEHLLLPLAPMFVHGECIGIASGDERHHCTSRAGTLNSGAVARPLTGNDIEVGQSPMRTAY
jgi:hypothetical protein